jgi:hypothetical protein
MPHAIRRDKGLFQHFKLLTGSDEVTSYILPGFAMDLKDIFVEG